MRILHVRDTNFGSENKQLQAPQNPDRQRPPTTAHGRCEKRRSVYGGHQNEHLIGQVGRGYPPFEDPETFAVGVLKLFTAPLLVQRGDGDR